MTKFDPRAPRGEYQKYQVDIVISEPSTNLTYVARVVAKSIIPLARVSASAVGKSLQRCILKIIAPNIDPLDINTAITAALRLHYPTISTNTRRVAAVEKRAFPSKVDLNYGRLMILKSLDDTAYTALPRLEFLTGLSRIAIPINYLLKRNMIERNPNNYAQFRRTAAGKSFMSSNK